MYETLLNLFTWQNRDQVYRVRFADGDEYDLSDCFGGIDDGEEPHATASIVRTLKSKNSLQSGTELFFKLSEIAEVTLVEAGIACYKAV